MLEKKTNLSDRLNTSSTMGQRI